MPLQKLQFRPGVNREGTTLANEGGWFECDKVRFRSGYPEKIGGWSAITYTTFKGTCRSLWNWITLKGYNLLGVGTHLKFYIEDGGTYYDITPIAATTNPMGNNPFATAYTTLSAAISATATTIPLTSATTFPSIGGFIKIGTEEIEYAATSGNTLIDCIRGINGTTAATHAISAPVGCATLTVTDTAHAVESNSFVDYSNVTSFDGFSASDLNTSASLHIPSFQVQYLSGTTYTITVTNQTTGQFIYSTSAVAGGGSSVKAEYELDAGLEIYSLGTGWGAGPWSRGSWGSGYTGAATGIGLQLRLWSQTNFGEVLLFSPRGGSLYYWAPGGAGTPDFATRGAIVTGTEVPTSINQILVSDATRICIAFGATSYSFDTPASTFDPMLIRWSAQEDYNNWLPATTNQAGSYRLSHGSFIMGALQTRQEILVWSDSSIYSMQYLGAPYVWGFTLLADNISIISPNAMATANGVTYWMGTDKFYIYSGRVETLPCALRSYVFDDINKNQAFQFFAGTNEAYSEVWWFYCENDADAVGRYVIFNYLDRVWYYGTMTRSAWLDSPLRQFPQAATLNNLIVFHEAAVDDGTTNPPSPIDSYIQSSDFDIGDGHNYGFVWQIVPDITFDGSNTASPGFPSVNFTVRPRQNPGAAYGIADAPAVTSAVSYAQRNTYNVQQFTQLVNTRIRGRQMAFKVECNTLGTQWQLGTPRLNVRPDGRR